MHTMLERGIECQHTRIQHISIEIETHQIGINHPHRGAGVDTQLIQIKHAGACDQSGQGFTQRYRLLRGTTDRKLGGAQRTQLHTDLCKSSHHTNENERNKQRGQKQAGQSKKKESHPIGPA